MDYACKTLISKIRNNVVFHINIHRNLRIQPNTHHQKLSARQCFRISMMEMVMYDRVVYLWHLIRSGWKIAMGNVRHFLELKLTREKQNKIWYQEINDFVRTFVFFFRIIIVIFYCHLFTFEAGMVSLQSISTGRTKH